MVDMRQVILDLRHTHPQWAIDSLVDYADMLHQRAVAAEATVQRVREALETKFYTHSQHEEDALVYADRIEEALR